MPVIPELFRKTTVKSIGSIYDFDEYKVLIQEYVEDGEWFTVAGLRRTGKTTLVRSVVRSLRVPSIYVNLWELVPGEVSLKALINEMLREFGREFAGRVRSIRRHIKEIVLFGVGIKFSEEKPSEGLTRVIEQILERRGKLVVILDEVQELDRDFPRLIKYLAALHDLFAPNLVVILLGSIVSLKNMLDMIKGTPMRGRMTKEIVLRPFDIITAIGFLRKGFSLCGIELPDNVLRHIVEYLGGFPGWLAEYGRAFIRHYRRSRQMPDPIKIMDYVYTEAKETIYEEVAKLISQRRKLINYIRILNHAAINISVTPSEIAGLLNIKRNTAHKYLRFLNERALLGEKNGRYYIEDPLVRRAMAEPDAIDRVLLAFKRIIMD